MTGNAAPPAIAAAAEAIEREFAAIGDWSGQLQHLMALGRAFPRLSAAERTEDSRIHGCQSQLWVVVRRDGARVRIEADSDAMVTRGALSLLVRLYDDREPAAVLDDLRGGGGRLSVIERLAPNRTNGLRALLGRIEAAARAVEARCEPAP